MNKKVYTFELNGRSVLGFDTGLNAEGFARVKLSRLITNPGSIVYPTGDIETWLPGGVTELETGSGKSMIIWGPSFPGVELTVILNTHNRRDLPIDVQRRDEALDAFRYWLKARITLEENLRENIEPPFNGPAGAFIVSGKKTEEPYDETGADKDPRLSEYYPAGTIFFPPAQLLQRSLEAGNAAPEAESWVHPDLDGANGISFCAGTMLYRIFCGIPPFSRNNTELLRQDMREGVFIPPKLAAPGIDEEVAAVLTMAINRAPQGGKGEKLRPPPEFIRDLFGPPSSKPASSWLQHLSDDEKKQICSEKERYRRTTDAKIKTRRFMVNNAAIIALALIVFAAAMFFIQQTNRNLAELPSTSGMNPAEVAETYYNSFAALDHATMDACVSGKAGKQDINMVTSLYVVTKARQAYELNRENFISALRWLEEGRPETDRIVFGITDLKIRILSWDDEKASVESSYILWMPGESSVEDHAIKDRLEFACRKGSWRITKIVRSP